MEEQKSEEVVKETTQEMTQEATSNETSVETTTGERPGFLTVLCILTFIWSGIAILGSLLGMLGMGALMSMFGGAAAGGSLYMIAILIVTIVSLFGAIQMWGLNKKGFTYYAAANGIGLIMPYVFGFPFVFSSFMIGLLITGGFIVMYYLNIKHMS